MSFDEVLPMMATVFAGDVSMDVWAKKNADTLTGADEATIIEEEAAAAQEAWDLVVKEEEADCAGETWTEPVWEESVVDWETLA